MDKFLIILPHILLGIFCAVALYIVMGRKYSIKKTLLIGIPLVIIVLAVNTIVFMNISVPDDKLKDVMYFWFSISFYTPICLIMLLLGKRKWMSYVTAGVNTFLAYYFIAMAGKMLSERTQPEFIYIWFLVIFPFTIIFIKIVYVKLQDMLEELLPKNVWILGGYAMLMILEIYAYSELIKSYADASEKLEVFGIALTSVYVISIIIIYFIIIHYHATFIENSNLILMKGQVQAIQDQYKLREMKEEELRILRHDMKHILITVSSLINEDKKAEALEFIDNYVNTITATKGKVYCNDSIINSILNYYSDKAEKDDVVLNIKINNIEDVLNVPPYETAVLISNCLDNAIKAANKLKNNRIVDFTFWNNDGRLILQCKNNYDGIILIDKDGRPTNLAKGHGLGSDSIELFAKKHGLTISYDITENVYKISIIF